jgi:hypothetical protein
MITIFENPSYTFKYYRRTVFVRNFIAVKTNIWLPKVMQSSGTSRKWDEAPTYVHTKNHKSSTIFVCYSTTNASKSI